MFGYSIVKNGDRLEREHKKYKKIAEKYAKFEWNFGWFEPVMFKCSSDGYIRYLELENVCGELDRLQLKYNVLLSLAKYYNVDVEKDVEKQVTGLHKIKCGGDNR